MSSSLFEDIVKSQNSGHEVAEQKSSVTYLVFKCGGENYAIDSTEVREILRNNEVYPMPFVPEYIPGVINSYGLPYAVLDFCRFLGHEEVDSPLFLILKNQDNISLQVSEIQEFHSKEDVEVQTLGNTEDASWFTGAISFDGQSAPVLDVASIIEKVRSDLENS